MGLKAGGNAVDAVEMMIKMMEDREITNAGFGSNLTLEGEVECDATIVDHYGRNGAVGAVSRIKNPISLARILLNETTKPMLLARVPPNLLVGEGATNYAIEKGMEIFPPSKMVSHGASERWKNWKRDLDTANERFNTAPASPPGGTTQVPATVAVHQRQIHTPNSSPRSQSSRFSQASPTRCARPLVESAADTPTTEAQSSRRDYIGDANQGFRSPLPYEGVLPAQRRMADGQTMSSPTSERHRSSQGHARASASHSMPINPEIVDEAIIQSLALDSSGWRLHQSSPEGSDPKKAKLNRTLDGSSDDQEEELKPVGRKRKRRPFNVFAPVMSPFAAELDRSKQDLITDTVGAIVVDYEGRIAAGSSSGGIGMKHKGRAGPAALVGIGTTVVPAEPGDPDQVSVATVTSGTGEHMATTMAAHTCADRVYHCIRRKSQGGLEYASEDEALKSMIETDFMGHPGVKHSPCVGALGVMAVKSTKDGIFLYFGHNTESFVSHHDSTFESTIANE
ncbi:MAG: hypothetical protein Q9160_001624 [Pyrenula sp. 1 TL-2023]